MKKTLQNLKHKYNATSLKELLKNLLLSHHTPHQIATGFAIGLFLSILPTFGLGMILALAISIKKKYNLLATYLGSLIVNPFTAVFIYTFNFTVGNALSANPLPTPSSFTMSMIPSIAFQLYLGSILVASVISYLSYHIIIKIIKYHRNKHAKNKK